MRNLVSTAELASSILNEDFGVAEVLAQDDETNCIYIGGSGCNVACVNAASLQVLWVADLMDLAAVAGCMLPLDASITSLSFSPDLQALTVALSSGAILLLTTSAGPPTVEEVGSVEGGVVALSWSPDGEALAVLGGLGQLLLLAPTWDLLCEVLVTDNSPACPQPTAPPSIATSSSSNGAALPLFGGAGAAGLSWRGDGRYLATCAPDGPGAPARVRIWDREAGELHALGEVMPGTVAAGAAWQPNGRHLYVAQRCGDAEEGTKGVAVERETKEAPRGAQGQAPEVRHVGAWKRELRRRQEAAEAAGTTATANKICMFERNGLRHGSFDVPTFFSDGREGEVEALSWSPDSQILGVVLVSGGGEGDLDPSTRLLQLWHRSNWHWYLKWERHYLGSGGLLLSWGPGAQGSLELRTVTAEGRVSVLRFAWDACISALGTAAVMDGASILLTPLRESIVPPPMCTAAVALPAPAVAVALRNALRDGAGASAEAVLAVLSDGRLAVVESVEEDLWEESLEEQLEETPWGRSGLPRLLPRLLQPPPSLASLGGEKTARAAAWLGPEAVLLVVHSGADEQDVLLECCLSNSGDAASCEEVAAVPAPGPVARCVCCISGALLELEGGALWLYSPGGTLQVLPSPFPCTCPRISALPPTSNISSSLILGPAMGLTGRGELYWGAAQVAADVTSFAVRYRGPGGPFLLYTTRSHALRTLPLSAVAATASSSRGRLQTGAQSYAVPELRLLAAEAGKRAGGGGGDDKAADPSFRSIEEGSLLVAAPADTSDVIYQAPRGNLETVRPRALVLPAVAALLDAGELVAAWDLATVNRLDLNVLADYKWPRFLSQVDSFVDAVGADGDVAGFLAGLTPGNITVGPEGMYASIMSSSSSSAGFGAPEGQEAAEKVTVVCAAVAAAVAAKDGGKWLRTQLTALSKCGDLAGALKRVKELKEAELAALERGEKAVMHGRNEGGAISAEAGLKHMMLYTPEEELYRAALGSYELEVAYMVVTHSQRDPGEYLIELQRFAAIEDLPLRRHAIDVHLRRFDSALRHLIDAGDAHFPAALSLAREHSLLRLLLQLTESRPELRRQAHTALAEELEGKGRHEDAAMAFVAAGDLERALRAYRLAGKWRPALMLAARLGRTSEQVAAMAARLAVDLEDGVMPADAAAVTLEYLDDVPAGVRLLTVAGEWREALRVAHARGRGDLEATLIAPEAAAAAMRVLENVREDAERVHKYLARLRELRGRREAVAAAVAAAEEEAGPGAFQVDDDLETEAASMVSGLSIYTQGTLAGGGGSLSSASVTTIGGRKPKKKNKGKDRARSGKVRQGSPEEEAQLGRHLLTLAPLPSVCEETGQLTELLVLLGHEEDAVKLQGALKELVDGHLAAVEDLMQHPPPGLSLELNARAKERAAVGPAGLAALEAATAAVAGAELQQKAAEAAAAAKRSDWKWEILRDP